MLEILIDRFSCSLYESNGFVVYRGERAILVCKRMLGLQQAVVRLGEAVVPAYMAAPTLPSIRQSHPNQFQLHLFVDITRTPSRSPDLATRQCPILRTSSATISRVPTFSTAVAKASPPSLLKHCIDTVTESIIQIDSPPVADIKFNHTPTADRFWVLARRL